MAVERTFSIIKPDATERNLTGAVNAIVEGAGLPSSRKNACASRASSPDILRRARERPFFGDCLF